MALIAGLVIDITGDAGLYASISRQMVESGDWFNLKINGSFYDQKPHLLFWLAGLGIKIWGNTNFAYKLFPFLFGLSTIYVTYRLSNEFFNRQTAKLAALFLASSQLFVLYLFDIHTDTVLQAAVSLAIWQLLLYLKYNKTLNFILGFTGLGFALLSKGPVGAVLPFFIVLFYLIFNKRKAEIFKIKWFFGILLSLLVVSPALVFLYMRFGLDGINFFFITNNLGRITGELIGTSTDPFFYITTLLWAFIPWLIFLPGAIYNALKKNDIKNKNVSRVLLAAVLILFFILSSARGKAPNYILIIIMPLSVVTADFVAGLLGRSQKLLVKMPFKIFTLLFVIFVFCVLILFSNKNLIVIAVTGLTLSVALLLIFQNNEINYNLILALFLTSASLNFILNISVIPSLFEYQGARQVLAIYEKERESNDVLINLHPEEYELFYYAKTPVTQFTNWNNFYKQFEKPGTWVYTTKAGYDGILKLNHKLEKVYKIDYRDMNELSLRFLNPQTRKTALCRNYLIKVK